MRGRDDESKCWRNDDVMERAARAHDDALGLGD